MLHLKEISAYITCLQLPSECQWLLFIPQDHATLWLGLQVYFDCMAVKKQNTQTYPMLLLQVIKTRCASKQLSSVLTRVKWDRVAVIPGDPFPEAQLLIVSLLVYKEISTCKIFATPCPPQSNH